MENLFILSNKGLNSLKAFNNKIYPEILLYIFYNNIHTRTVLEIQIKLNLFNNMLNK